MPDAKHQSAVTTKREPRLKGGVQESPQELQETLQQQRGEQAGFRVGEEKRIREDKQAAVQRAWAGRHETRQRLQRLFERMSR
jgi:hypothetical protein